MNIKEENKYLKEVLYLLGELAVANFDDFYLHIIDKILGTFRISEERYEQLLKEFSDSYQKIQEKQ